MTPELNHVDSRMSKCIFTEVQSEELLTHKFPVDANGIEIRPGYRPPFNSETGRQAAIKCARERARLVEDAKIARAALRQIHAMLTKRKSLKKPRLAGNHGVVTRDSKPTSNSPTISPRAAKKSASAVKPEGVNSVPTPQAEPRAPLKPAAQAAPETETPVDDCPF